VYDSLIFPFSSSLSYRWRNYLKEEIQILTSSFEKYATGALIGGVAGAIMALLLAPRSGAETREIIRQEMETKSKEAAEVLKEKAIVLKEKVVDVSTQLEEKGKETIARFKEVNRQTAEVTS
jgi:gas vesicle protein